MKLRKLVKRLVMFLIAVCICSGLYIGVQGYGMYRKALNTMSLTKKVEEIQKNSYYTEIEELPQTYKSAVISVEDHRFYSHWGIDPVALVRAFYNDLKAMAFVQGGSTITQQLAKNLYFTQEKEMTRKVAEVFMAFDLERNYTKDDILELYLNTIYFGDGYYGVGAASEGYFNKVPQNMNDYESTLLAGVPNAPSKYAPSKNLELAEKRQKQVIGRMVACGYFSQEEGETAANQVFVDAAALMVP